MLGEKHSLLDEFPEFKELIRKLENTDSSFTEKMKRYNKFDTDIRRLELDNAPINDESMTKLKHDRAVLKDLLYQQLISSK